MIYELIQNMAIILMIAYLFSKSPAAKPLAGEVLLGKHKVLLSVVFTGFALLGYGLAPSPELPVIDGRPIGIILSGLVAGLLSGLAVAGLAALYGVWNEGWLLLPLADGAGMLLLGLLSGLVHRTLLRRSQSERLFSPLLCLSVMLGGVALVQGLLTLLSETAQLDTPLQQLAVPLVLANTAGAALFMMMLRDRRTMFDKVGALISARALNIAERSLGIFGAGFNDTTARELAEIIYDETGVGAVGISDREQILAFVGEGADHHLAGLQIASPQTKEAIRDNKVIYADGVKEQFTCALSTDCPLGSALIVPLRVDNEVVGAIKLYEPKNKLFLNLNKTLGEGIAKLLSEQLLRYRYEEQKNLVVTSELRLIQAQVNPHFLFNALNTIMAVVRKDPDQARSLLLHLSNYFRKNLKRSSDLATLEEELDHVNSYLVIQKARFGDKLRIEQDIADRFLKIRVPTFTLQPIVENAVKHGISNMLGSGTVKISARCRDATIEVTVEDDAGAYCEKLKTEGLGMQIVDKRIKNLFGNQYGTQITCHPDELTRVTLQFPQPEGFAS